MPEEPFNPETLHGMSFWDKASGRKMRYIYPDAGHWSAGWLVVQNPSGCWMTLRKASDDDIATLNRAVGTGHHGEAQRAAIAEYIRRHPETE